MTFIEMTQVVEYMKKNGVDRFKFGELEVHFGIVPQEPTVPTIDDLTDEETRERAIEQMKQTFKAVAKADEADLFYSV